MVPTLMEPAIKEAHLKKWLEAAERIFVEFRDRRLEEVSQLVEVALHEMKTCGHPLTD
jgi:hypothetical protein